MRKLVLFLAGCLTLLAAVPVHAQEGEGRMVPNKNAYDFSFKKIDGGDLKLSSYKGKALLIVNTASECGFTPQYEGLEKLYETYKDRGFVIIGVPSNDFMGQEPGTNAEIKKFCQSRFGITFPMAEKVDVKGDHAHPFYKWAAEQENGDVPGWNFHKFLIATDGTLSDSFGSRTDPLSDDLTDAIEQILPSSPAPAKK